MRSRLIFLSIGLVVGSLLTYAAVWANGLRTDLVDESGTGSVKVSKTDVASSYLFEAAEVCVDGGEPVTVTQVRPIMSAGSAGKVTVAEFQLGPTDNVGGDWRKLKPGAKLNAWYEEVDTNNDLPNRINLACAPSNFERRTLAARLRVTEAPAALQGVMVDYTVHGITKTLRTNVGIALCRGDEKPDDAFDLEIDEDTENENVLLRCFTDEG